MSKGGGIHSWEVRMFISFACLWLSNLTLVFLTSFLTVYFTSALGVVNFNSMWGSCFQITILTWWFMHRSVWAAITKCCRPGDNRNELSHSSEGWKAEILEMAGLVSPEASIPGYQMAAFSWCHHWDEYPWYLFCVQSVQISSSYKDISQTGLDPILTAHFNSITSWKTFSPNTVTFWGTRG